METIAFSTKSLDWKTRYSFTPLHYATTGDTMISFAFAGASNSGVHTHDTNGAYNRFYGAYYPSKISVISNNNPSATKIYEAFSIEGSKGNWSVDFKTETGETQQSSLPSGSLVEREGKHYSDIPKNLNNQNAALTFVGTTTLSNLIRASTPGDQYYNKIRLTSKPHAIPSTLVFSISTYGFGGPENLDGGMSDTPGQLAVQQFGPGPGTAGGAEALIAWLALLGLDLGGADGPPTDGTWSKFDKPWIYSVNDNFQWEILPIDPFPEPSFFKSEFPLVWKYDPYLNTLDIDNTNNIAYSFDYLPLYGPDMFDLENKPDLDINDLINMEIGLYSISRTITNGEDMRGEYMRIDMQRSGTDYYELYAVNVDQHQTKLDHSLGQNN